MKDGMFRGLVPKKLRTSHEDIFIALRLRVAPLCRRVFLLQRGKERN